ncbi:Uncharacterised protein [Vibrio cholerae]|uniref:Uncharacterized protein n=1 Tax=Vibrio cholerae TaxID=666 RepID=A0A655RD25_VIBCL|nr:Uncharacterised protein [Vibrio cholerae]CSB90282.1 Uncharacterised protein [Vibrio cholerae]CSD22571.1 Uncharacterised protein [Vibrio cholerae]
MAALLVKSQRLQYPVRCIARLWVNRSEANISLCVVTTAKEEGPKNRLAA